jgi:hypothetical protein
VLLHGSHSKVFHVSVLACHAPPLNVIMVFRHNAVPPPGVFEQLFKLHTNVLLRIWDPGSRHFECNKHPVVVLGVKGPGVCRCFFALLFEQLLCQVR